MSDGMIITRDELRLLPKVEPVHARITISPSVQAGYIVVELWFYGLKTVVTVEDLALNDLRPVEPSATPPLAPCEPSAEELPDLDDCIAAWERVRGLHHEYMIAQRGDEKFRAGIAAVRALCLRAREAPTERAP